MEKKRKGGAEKLREKRKKALAHDAATSKNILTMFAAGAGLASGTSAVPAGPSQQQVMMSEEEGESEAPAAMVVQEQEIGGGDGRCVLA